MKITLNWLKRHLETTADLPTICQKLTAIGLEVESCEHEAKELEQFIVVKILEATPLENSQKLKICKVETADGKILQIICGASNARANLKTILAPIGVIITSNQLVIKKAKIAGIESEGMLCSATELNLVEFFGDNDGIIEIAEEFPIGTKLTDLIDKNDYIIEINITPNRGDCLNVRGIARDLAGAKLGTLKNLADVNRQLIEKLTKENQEQNFSQPSTSNKITDFNYQITEPETCPEIYFIAISNIKNKASPSWLAKDLAKIGLNSYSALVDLLNWQMIDSTQPLHIYDKSKINSEINIKIADAGSKFRPINNKNLTNQEYQLSGQELIIADKEKTLSLAGIIGSENSGCTSETTEIVIEAGLFDRITIANSARAHKISTDASYRFERGVNKEHIAETIKFVAEAIVAMCGNPSTITEKLVTIKPIESTATTIAFTTKKINQITGLELSDEIITSTLASLNINCHKEQNSKDYNNYVATIPSYRNDITIINDLAEEVLRIYGYDQITSCPPSSLQKFSKNWQIETADLIRREMVSFGFNETINWSFVNYEDAKKSNIANHQLKIANPISSELNYMRPNLLLGLVNVAKSNIARGTENLNLFEIGNVFLQDLPQGNVKMQMMASGLSCGDNLPINPFEKPRKIDIFDCKLWFLSIAKILQLNPNGFQYSKENLPPYYNPYRSTAINLGKNLLGYFGELHPKFLNEISFPKKSVQFFEIFLGDEAIFNKKVSKKTAVKSFTINDLPQVERDFAFILGTKTPLGEVVKTISAVNRNAIKEVVIFDIYQDQKLEKDTHSVAFRVFMQPEAKTFSGAEIEEISAKIIATLEQRYQAKLRQ